MSSLSLESFEAYSLPNVEFDIIYEHDLICKYKLTQHDVQEGDRIAIFKLGWQFLKDYVLFEWVTTKSGSVTFKEENLPKDSNEIYQLCYINADNMVLGVSKPIEFCKKIFNMYQSSSTFRDSLISSCNTIDSDTPATQNSVQEKVISKLKEENSLLKDVLKVVVMNNKLGNFEKELNDLKILTKYLKDTVINQQKEISSLRSTLLKHNELCQNLEPKDEQKKFNTDNFDLGDLKSIPPLPVLK